MSVRIMAPAILQDRRSHYLFIQSRKFELTMGDDFFTMRVTEMGDGVRRNCFRADDSYQ